LDSETFATTISPVTGLGSCRNASFLPSLLATRTAAPTCGVRVFNPHICKTLFEFGVAAKYPLPASTVRHCVFASRTFGVLDQ
jgi:hypothetical protein